ncbi:MAG: nuclear transport factor 2 family protein [Planctomycetes bacterium]|nr:nuclear transport factor 2 family protein [Planctomycetota bacterium]
MSKLVVVLALPLILLVPHNTQTSEADSEAIRQTALDYGQGWYAADGERMERALHPDLAKRSLMPDPRSGKGKIDHMSAMSLVQATRKGYGKSTPPEKQRTDVTILDVYGNAACVKLEMHDWVDYMQMSKIGGRWVIVNVLWEMTPEAKKRYGIPDEL